MYMCEGSVEKKELKSNKKWFDELREIDFFDSCPFFMDWGERGGGRVDLRILSCVSSNLSNYITEILISKLRLLRLRTAAKAFFDFCLINLSAKVPYCLLVSVLICSVLFRFCFCAPTFPSHLTATPLLLL